MSIRILLLENMLDSLDRLFDRQSLPIDVCALARATGQALESDALYPLLSGAADELSVLLQQELSPEQARDVALNITSSLRHALAETLPFP